MTTSSRAAIAVLTATLATPVLAVVPPAPTAAVPPARIAAVPPAPVAAVPPARIAAVPPDLPLARPAKAAADCLGGQGYLKARIRGALTADIDWRQYLACDGESRPDGSGVRLGFAGPPGPHRLRMIFGVRGVHEGAAARELPVNLTVLEEGGRIFATRGEGKCTIDDLRQQRQPGPGQTHTWRITARGFCTDPINDLASAPGSGRIVINRFDFAGVVTFAGGHQPVPRPLNP